MFRERAGGCMHVAAEGGTNLGRTVDEVEHAHGRLVWRGSIGAAKHLDCMRTAQGAIHTQTAHARLVEAGLELRTYDE